MSESFGGFDSIANIDTDRIRDLLRQTMVMGLPDDDQVPIFVTDRVVDWDKHDTEGSPWDFTDAPDTVVSPAKSVQVICAYEFFSPLGRQGAFNTEVGDFNPTTVVFTMFEDEFAEVNGSTYVTIGPSDTKWFFRFWKPTNALNDMIVYQCHFIAEGTD